MAGAAALFAAALALLLAAGRDPQRRAWAVLTIAGVILYLALRELPQLAPSGRDAPPGWNWGGHLLSLAGMLLLAGVLIRRGGVAARDFGFAPPSNLGPAAVVCAVALAAGYVLNTVAGGRPEREIPAATWIFFATLPGLAEEAAFRGVLLAAAERAAPAARTVAGVRLSAGAALLTLAFVGLHRFHFGLLTSVLPGALLYLWLRLKTGSVLVPIVAHNLWNLAVLAAHFDPSS